MKNKVFIIILIFCVTITSCDTNKNENQNLNNSTELKSEFISAIKEKALQKIQKENKENIIPIPVNPDNENYKYAYVDKNKLIEYINSSDSNYFYYEDFKNKVGFEFDEYYEYASEFNEKSNLAIINKSENTGYSEDGYPTYNRSQNLINKKGEKIVSTDYKELKILDDNQILYEGMYKTKENEFSPYFILDNNGKITRFLGMFSNTRQYKDILKLSRYYGYENEKNETLYYSIKEKEFIKEEPWCVDELYYDFKDSNFEISSGYEGLPNRYIYPKNSSGGDWVLNASLEGSYLVGDKKLIIKNKNEDENKIEKNKNEDNSKDENDDIKVYYKIIYNEKFNEVLTDKFADFYHLGDNYYFVTEHKKNIEPESPYYYRTYCYDWEKDCRVNAIYDGKNISDYKYFIIKYLGNDIFYLFDGEKFEFINFKSKKSVYEHVDIELNIDKFKVYDGLIIAEIDYQNAMLITDKNYMIVSKKET